MRIPAVILLLAALAGAACSRSAPVPPAVTVFAAASTTDVMRHAGRRFEDATGIRVVFSFDSSSNLARQIRAGSPADVYLSADVKWMDELAAAGAIQESTRRDLLANDLVMIAPVNSGAVPVEMSSDFDFAERLPQIERIAVGDPDHVPAGRYAKQALIALGWWETLQPRVIPAQDVRAALRLVEMSEADAGIVYFTDAIASANVKVIGRFPAELHEPIVYPIAQCGDSARAMDFIEFLESPEMIEAFREAGFRVLGEPQDGGG